MNKNLFFDFYNNQSEQLLWEQFAIESIQQYGHDVYFIPMKLNKLDVLYGEDELASYEQAFDSTVYIKSFDSYGGDGTFLSKFNLEVRDQLILIMAQRPFREEIGSALGVDRPKEGDLIYSSMIKRLFIIKYVDKTEKFYPLGTLPSWSLTCEVFEYSNENISTGIPEIDAIQTENSFAGTGDAPISNTQYEQVLGDFFADNQDISQEGTGLIDWSNIDPFSNGTI